MQRYKAIKKILSEIKRYDPDAVANTEPTNTADKPKDNARMVGTMERPKGSLRLHNRKFSILTPMIQAEKGEHDKWKEKVVLAKVEFEIKGPW